MGAAVDPTRRSYDRVAVRRPRRAGPDARAVPDLHPIGSAATEAVAAAELLRSGSAPWPLVGRVMAAKPVIGVANAAYRLIARNRHRLPGATPACQVAQGPMTGADAA